MSAGSEFHTEGAATLKLREAKVVWTRGTVVRVGFLEEMNLKPYFHYGCALRCVAREIETLSASLCLSPRNATRSRNGNKPLSPELLATYGCRSRGDVLLS